jgi:alpha-ketoglutarate-dependent taurine dioxygenase
MRDSRIEIRPTSGALGAEVSGVDLADELDAAVVSDIRQAFNAHGVIFFRDQRLTPEQHIAFAERMGRININRFFKAAPGYPQIAEVRKEPAQTTNIGGGWHTDHSYDQIPALGSILLARELPPRGGDTMFACMGQAYDALSDGLKRTLRGLRAVHSSRQVFGVKAQQANPDRQDRLLNPKLATQDAVHPVVIRHPDTGRPTLYVNAGFTTHFEGWTEKESKPLLDFLYQHASRPEFQTRFKWEEGSIAFWDNRATWHYALNDYQGERRLMHRITIEGVELKAAQ